MENQQRPRQQQQRMGKTKLKLKTFFGGFHKQKELLDRDYESKTSIELYKNKRYIMTVATTTTSRRIFWAVWSIFGHVVHLVSKYYDC